MVIAKSKEPGHTEFEVDGKGTDVLAGCLSIVGSMYALLKETMGEAAAEVYKEHVINDFDKLANTTEPIKEVS